MPFTDLIVWYLGIYGIAWSIVYSNIWPFSYRDYIASKSLFLAKVLTCIVCASFWTSTILVNWYFATELWYTKLLVCFSTVSVSWALANMLDDTND